MMEPLSLEFIATACAGQLHGNPATRVSRVCTDSRQVRPGDLFIALRGERFDGHAFVSDAAAGGAAAVLGERDRLMSRALPCPVIHVAEGRQALGALAAAYRGQFGLPVVAVGGANGKTTTKDLLATLLRQRFVTLASPASFNNDIGLPLTLLELDRAHEVAVLEVGTNHPGELAPLVRLAQPRYGIVTSLGREHLEFFGNLAGAIEEEGALAAGLPPDGRLFLNADCPGAEEVAARSRAPVTRIGSQANCDWRLTDCHLDALGTAFAVAAPTAAWSGEYRLRLLGRHQATNALLAMAVSAALGLDSAAVRRGLATSRPAKMRLEMHEVGGIHLLDDSYNANEDSMRAALETLAELGRCSRRIAVLGEMGELGEHTEAAHREVGQHAAALGLTCLCTVGPTASMLAAAARQAGLSAVREFPDADAATDALLEQLHDGDWVLIKASRSARLERIGQRLRQAKPLPPASMSRPPAIYSTACSII